MQLTYYNNKTDRRYINKTIEQIALAGHSNPVTIKMIDNTTVAHPTFMMRDVDIYMTANYCYVDDLHRYYYIDNVELSQGYAYLHCTEDVLMTYKNEIPGLEVIASRNEIDYNLYQVDNEMMVNNYPSVERIEFAKGFDKNKQNFMLCVIGDTSGGENSGN